MLKCVANHNLRQKCKLERYVVRSIIILFICGLMIECMNYSQKLKMKEKCSYLDPKIELNHNNKLNKNIN
jgi:hypothetical protein